MTKRICSIVAIGLGVVLQETVAHAQLIEKCGERIGQSLQARHANLVVDRGDQFIFDQPGFGISRSNMQIAVRWKATDPWVPCSLDGDAFDCAGLFKISGGHADPLDGAGPGGYGGISLISRNNVSVWSEYISGSLLSCEITGQPVPATTGESSGVPEWKLPVSLAWVAAYQTGLRNDQDPKLQYQIRFTFNGYTVPFREKAVF